ncbi:MAG: hypothetical protein Q8R79_04045, partial [Legionellaceae bacterium]|nr:hypothetical protein [Legionellaceae bacterium]
LSEDIVFDYMCCQEEAKQDSSLKAPCFRDMMEYADDVLKGVAAAPTQVVGITANENTLEPQGSGSSDSDTSPSATNKQSKKTAVPKDNIPIPETLEDLKTALCGLLQGYLNKRVSHINDKSIKVTARTFFFRSTNVTRDKARDVYTLQKNIKAESDPKKLVKLLEDAILKNTKLQESIRHLPFMKSALSRTLETANFLCKNFVEKYPPAPSV